ncbi:50S ribosomal protein L25/general stress protein Ctc [Oceanobacillus piezotolerans]|uniref:Large ribosomal subunit protein bL25 n=1 Tax=Oceanobacillus piezotolerans TaxID=2448030 RepID=A0A498D2D5_9BACI|nr:50S ribosomal protein L25/general stress protein Ctc [Oceanobacillus piezotolerans]RLL41683.1 50S ribosomal protein L25/general stress protein Ctc [Oceanobacillus piezotolerans]
MSISLKVSKREDLTKSNTKQLRESGQVPGVLYGKDQDPQPIAVDSIELLKTIRDQGKNAILTLEIADDQKVDVMFHDYQMDPIKNELLHADFYKANMSEAMDVSVPLKVVGEPKEGILQQPLFEVQLRAKPGDIPEEVSIDVSNLNLGESLTIADLTADDKYEILDDQEKTIVTILQPDAFKEPEQLPEEDAEAESSEENDKE